MWIDSLSPEARAGLCAADRAALTELPECELLPGQTLFRPGEAASGFLVLLSGRVEVFLTGAGGREILLYAVAPGQSCIQSTLGLLGGDSYSGHAVVARRCRAVMIPRGLFLRLMDDSAGFRGFVLRAFGQRMADVTALLSRVAFGRVEARLARELLDLAAARPASAETPQQVRITHEALATRIGTAREVVSRRLEALARQGLIETGRGQVRLLDARALARIASETVT